MAPFRKKIVCSFLLLLWFLPGVPAESILVSTRYPEGKVTGKEHAAWYESGVMDTLFSAGHLVMSTAANEVAYHEEFEESAVRIAKNCGVRYLLEVRIDFATALPEENDPRSAVYRLYDVAGERELTEGVMSISDPEAEAVMNAGSLLASKMLERF